MSISDKKAKVLANLPDFLDWEEKYRHIIELGRKLPAMGPEEKTDAYLIEGCISRAWLFPRIEKDKLFFSGDSESAIVKGILAIMIAIYSGNRPEEILSLKPDFLKEVGITDHLSMNRRNGLAHICKQINLYATVSQAKLQASA